MIGLSILFAATAYIWLVGFITKRLENRVAKYTVVAISIMIPTWDVIPGKIYFNHLCGSEAGINIYKIVEGVEGYRVHSNSSGLVQQALQEYGYRFVEVKNDGQLYRYILNSRKQVIKQKVFESMAVYGVGVEIHKLLWNVIQVDEFVFNLYTKEWLAVRTSFSAHGNWLQEIFSPYLGGTNSCKNILPTSRDLYLKTLKPTKTTN